MTNLEGNFNSSVLLKVLETLSSRNPASTLLISDGRNEKVVYFSTGGVRLYASKDRRIATLEDFLVRHELLTSDQLTFALEARDQDRRESLAEVLERKGFLPRARYLEAVSELIHLEIYDLVTWENAIHEFYEGNPPPEIFDSDHPALFVAMDIKNLCSRVKEWTMEWADLKSKLYSERLRLKLLASPEKLAQEEELSTLTRKVYRFIDGRRCLRDISLAAGLSFPNVARVTHAGLKSRHLRGNLVVEKAADTSDAMLSEIEQLEEALDNAINTILIHKRIARAYEKLDDPDRASEHYETIGDLHAVAGRLGQAMESYHQAIALSPHNISVHETLIQRLQDNNQENKAGAEIVKLAQKLVSFGLLERAFSTLRVLKGKMAGLFEARVLLADILVKLGRINEALAEYLGIAREKKKSGSMEGLEEVYRKILSLDSTNRDARLGLSLERRRMAGEKLVWTHRLCAAAAVLLLLVWGSSEAFSVVSFQKAEASMQASSAQGDKQGLEELWKIGRKYPASLHSASLLEVEKDLYREAFYRHESNLETASRLQKEGSLTAAVATYQRVLDANLTPSQKRRARKGLHAAGSRAEEGASLRREAESYLQARFYQDAFGLCREILEKFPEQASGLQVPFLIRSVPAEARVKINGINWGFTPTWISVSLGDSLSVQLEKDGYALESLGGFEEQRTPFMTIQLRKN